MITGYIDLYIPRITRKLLGVARSLGYKIIVSSATDKRIEKMDSVLIVRGIVITEENASSLKHRLKGVREKYVIVLVKPLSTPTARLAAHDSRVDGVVISCDNTAYIDPGQAGLMRQFSKPLILPITILSDCDERGLARIYRRILLFRSRDLDILPASFAENVGDLIAPWTTPRLLSEIFGLGWDYWLYGISNAPNELLVKNGVWA